MVGRMICADILRIIITIKDAIPLQLTLLIIIVQEFTEW